MEHGKVTREVHDRINHIRRAYAQKHIGSSKSNWQKFGEYTRKPWFCKNFQTGMLALVKDHEMVGYTIIFVVFFAFLWVTNCNM